MDAKQNKLEEKLADLLKQAAEVASALQACNRHALDLCGILSSILNCDRRPTVVFVLETRTNGRTPNGPASGERATNAN
jgi:hypothetical protein